MEEKKFSEPIWETLDVESLTIGDILTQKQIALADRMGMDYFNYISHNDCNLRDFFKKSSVSFKHNGSIKKYDLSLIYDKINAKYGERLFSSLVKIRSIYKISRNQKLIDIDKVIRNLDPGKSVHELFENSEEYIPFLLSTMHPEQTSAWALIELVKILSGSPQVETLFTLLSSFNALSKQRNENLEKAKKKKKG